MYETLHEFFRINRPIVLFLYGLTFFVTGFAIFLQSRRRSRLRLARDLYWLAAFGILHGVHEWGAMFIPIQAAYTPRVLIDLLQTIQVTLLALSFFCLMMFGAFTLERRYPSLKKLVIIIGIIWGVGFWLAYYSQPTIIDWHNTSNIWARYLLGLPGSLLAAYGLQYQAQTNIAPLKVQFIYQTLRIAGGALLAYAVLGGLIVPRADFFPANVLNYPLFDDVVGIPVQVLRSFIGLLLAFSIIRALEIFEIELDHFIEGMEIEHVQAAERERIGQEIHDGAIQGVYSASLILESMQPLMEAGTEASRRLEQAKNVLNAVNTDLRSYMISLRTVSPPDPLVPSLQTLITNPRFRGLLDIDLVCDIEPNFKPIQTHHILSIVQESLSNTLRHARARHVKVTVRRENSMIVILIEDNGRGFAIDEVPAGYGLRSIRDRARLLGGQLDITSSPGKGTNVMLVLPEEKSL
ncbi:MAG: sensor histidine kinase [Chloroflexi bacterium]|uniref:sensor histidine kinase n=1 Tax=Candidatus Flexifilum breve TaxID=3140694 RepID=UPI003134780C|nr:sensor histidine kinase [Chloroflexota bacterium]